MRIPGTGVMPAATPLLRIPSLSGRPRRMYRRSRLFLFQPQYGPFDRPSQLVNLDELVRVATKYGLTVKVTGAADSATGTVGINDALSVSRADYIASELNKRGLPSDRITKTGEGGISDYVPTEANRHSKVELFFDKLEKTEIHP